MKRILPLAFTAALLVIGASACRILGGPPRNLINMYGEWQCFDNLWVSAGPGDNGISVKHMEAYGPVVKTAKDWRTGSGWFVYAEKPDRVWVFNGESLQLLVITPPVGSATYVNNFPVPIPDVVKSRLPGRTY